MPDRRSTIEIRAAQLCKLAAAGDPKLREAAERYLKDAYKRGTFRGYIDGWNAAKKHWRPHKRQALQMEAQQEAP